MNANHRSGRRGEVTLQDLLMLQLLVLAPIAGLVYGIRFGGNYGLLGQFIGAVIGAVAALAAALGGLYAFAVVLEPFRRFWGWWRPYPPPCENGCCRTYRDYIDESLAEELRSRWKGLSSSAHRCRCGYLYGGGYDRPLLNRWVRVLPDGTLRPYLKHGVFGRWRRDDPQSIIAVAQSPPRAEIQIPDWLVPLATEILSGGIASIVVFSDPLNHALSYPFILCCAMLGFIAGSVAILRERRAKLHS